VLKKYHSKLVVGTLEGFVHHTERILHSDPAWILGTNAPPAWMRPSHKEWQKSVRLFVSNVLLPGLDAWQDGKEPPSEVLQQIGKQGYREKKKKKQRFLGCFFFLFVCL
jgi:hypothetical protein